MVILYAMHLGYTNQKPHQAMVTKKDFSAFSSQVISAFIPNMALKSPNIISIVCQQSRKYNYPVYKSIKSNCNLEYANTTKHFSTYIKH